MMTKISVEEAKERLPELLDEGAKGEEIMITDGDGATYKVIVKVMDSTMQTKRIAGLGRGNVAFISEDFDAELPDSFWLGEE